MLVLWALGSEFFVELPKKVRLVSMGADESNVDNVKGVEFAPK